MICKLPLIVIIIKKKNLIASHTKLDPLLPSVVCRMQHNFSSFSYAKLLPHIVSVKENFVVPLERIYGPLPCHILNFHVKIFSDNYAQYIQNKRIKFTTSDSGFNSSCLITALAGGALKKCDESI